MRTHARTTAAIASAPASPKNGAAKPPVRPSPAHHGPRRAERQPDHRVDSAEAADRIAPEAASLEHGRQGKEAADAETERRCSDELTACSLRCHDRPAESVEREHAHHYGARVDPVISQPAPSSRRSRTARIADGTSAAAYANPASRDAAPESAGTTDTASARPMPPTISQKFHGRAASPRAHRLGARDHRARARAPP